MVVATVEVVVITKDDAGSYDCKVEVVRTPETFGRKQVNSLVAKIDAVVPWLLMNSLVFGPEFKVFIKVDQ